MLSESIFVDIKEKNYTLIRIGNYAEHCFYKEGSYINTFLEENKAQENLFLFKGNCDKIVWDLMHKVMEFPDQLTDMAAEC